MITKFGEKGVINLGKAIPLVGGVIGGTFDGTTTYAIGRVARSVFVTGDEPSEDPEEADVVDDLSEMLFGEGNRNNAGGREAFFWGEDGGDPPVRPDKPRWWSRG